MWGSRVSLLWKAYFHPTTDDNLPAPRWIRHFETDLTEIENEYCDRTIEKLISKDQPKSTGRNHDYDHISTDQLTYICLAVET